MLGVEPVARERLARGGFALGNFVLVMRKGEVYAAGVNVERFTEIFHGHGGALYVPARTAGADGGFPEMLARFRRFPKRKVPRTFFLVAVIVDARAGLNAGEIDFGEFSVVRKPGDAIVDRTFARIRESFLLKPLDELNHVLDVVGGANPVFGGFDAERFAIVEESLRKFFGVVANVFSCRGGVGDNAVVHVREIDDV